MILKKKLIREKFRREGNFYAYIVKCADGTYYAGYTNDLKERLKRHNNGLASKYTRARLPVSLVWKKEYRQFRSAFKAEIIIKQLTRSQKETLVGGRRLDKVLKDAKVKKK